MHSPALIPQSVPGCVPSGFPGGLGRTTLPEDFRSLFDGAYEKIFQRYDDETWIYPGHGDDTVLGNERPHLAEWRARGW